MSETKQTVDTVLTNASMSDRDLLLKIAGHIEVLNHEHEQMVTWRDQVNVWRGAVDHLLKDLKWAKRGALLGAGATLIGVLLNVINTVRHF